MKRALKWIAGISIGILLLDIIVASGIFLFWYFWL
jgi:hypothetical protein